MITNTFDDTREQMYQLLREREQILSDYQKDEEISEFDKVSIKNIDCLLSILLKNRVTKLRKEYGKL
jgi:hypothetical protein